MTHNGTPAGSEPAKMLAKELQALLERFTGVGRPVSPHHVVEIAAVAVPHAHHAGITLLRPNRPAVTVAASDDVPGAVDALQYTWDEGPCLDAATGPAVLRSDDVSTDSRWPAFGPRCVEATGIRSMLSLRLPVGGEDCAAINFYSTKVRAFTEQDITVASVIVPLAALAIEAGLRQLDHDNLLQALESSRHISTAVGIVMITHHVRSEAAFELLRQASMNLNTKLSAIADLVNDTGALPGEPRMSGL